MISTFMKILPSKYLPLALTKWEYLHKYGFKIDKRVKEDNDLDNS